MRNSFCDTGKMRIFSASRDFFSDFVSQTPYSLPDVKLISLKRKSVPPFDEKFSQMVTLALGMLTFLKLQSLAVQT